MTTFENIYVWADLRFKMTAFGQNQNYYSRVFIILGNDKIWYDHSWRLPSLAIIMFGNHQLKGAN